MGGQIIANYLSSDSNGSHYAIELTTYRDTAGIAMQLSAEFEIYSQDTSGNWNYLFNSTVNYDSTSGNFLSTVQTVYGVEVYTFNDTIVLPGNGYYAIRWSECCRNGAIINMSSPLQESMKLLTYITVDSVTPNSSPSYLTPPVAYLPIHTIWQYNPLPFDPDGDSLSWSIEIPLDDNGAVNGYEFLSDSIYSDSNAVFSLDSVTGSLSWSASLVGHFSASFVISEFRNGLKIGEMRRDMQFIVTPDTSNSMPNISNMQTVPTNTGGYPYVKINPGQNYQLHLLANDADPNDVLTMDAYGESFSLATSPSNLSVVNTGNGNEIQGTFSWTPDVSSVRTHPYIVVFRTSDNVFYHDETIQFEVTQSSTDILNYSLNLVLDEIYPNPANNKIYIPILSDLNREITIEMVNVLGKKVSSKSLGISSGTNLVIQDLNIDLGQYILIIRDENYQIIDSQYFTVIK
tara:strand:+ start:1255 stop:2634 length:1380 start_codon:yes stop_codon:yes gene_type:complete